MSESRCGPIHIDMRIFGTIAHSGTVAPMATNCTCMGLRRSYSTTRPSGIFSTNTRLQRRYQTSNRHTRLPVMSRHCCSSTLQPRCWSQALTRSVDVPPSVVPRPSYTGQPLTT
ncbi:hypothetical protein D3C85_1356960 [compost metagenome]